MEIGIVKGTGCTKIDTRYRMILDFGYWMLDAGYWMRKKWRLIGIDGDWGL